MVTVVSIDRRKTIRELKTVILEVLLFVIVIFVVIVIIVVIVISYYC